MSDETKTKKPTAQQQIDELKGDMKKLDGYMNRILDTLEKQEQRLEEKREKVGIKPTPGLEYIGPMSPKNIYAEYAKPYVTADKSKQYRYCLDHRDALIQRRMYGWEPVKDEKGNDVRFGDQVLTSMSRTKYQETIAIPRQKRIEHKRQANASVATDAANDLRREVKRGDVKFSGAYEVKYDDEPIQEGVKNE